MKVLELFSGTRSVSRAFEKRGHQTFAIDYDRQLLANAHCDVETLTAEQILEWFGKPDVIWASPDCTTYSVAALGRHRRKNEETGQLEPQTLYARKCDLVVGGSPCQSFSIAGKREGLQGESGLMFEYIRAVREVRPRWFLWENVPGALSSEGGEAFRQLLSEMDKLGYGLAWRVLDAQFFGVAQRRRRLFLVGRLGACPPVEVLAEPESLRGDYPSSREKREALAAAARRGASSAGFKYSAGSTGCLNPEDPQSKRIFTPDSCGPTLSSGTGEGMNIQPSVAIPINEMVATRCNKLGRGTGFGVGKDGDPANTSTCNHPHAVATEPIAMADMIIRRLTPLECERLQGFPDNHTRIPYRGKPADECPDGPRYKAIGNSMAVPVMRWIGERIAMADKEEPIEGNTKFERA